MAWGTPRHPLPFLSPHSEKSGVIMAERRVQGSIEKATRKDLRRLATLDDVQAHAAMAIHLAQLIDRGGWEAAEHARLVSELRKTMIEVARRGTAAPATDTLDELRARRERRRQA